MAEAREQHLAARQRQDAARALQAAPVVGPTQPVLTASLPAHVNNNRADQNIAVAQEEIRRAARNHRTAIAAVDREIPRAAPALDEGDGEPDGVDSDGDVVVPHPAS